MKKLLFLLASSAFGQAVFTAGSPAAVAKPAQFVITAGTSVSCTLTGDTFPAKNVLITNCNAGGVTIPNFTIPSTVTLPWALTLQVNSGTAVSTFILQVTATAPNFVIQATVNGAAVVTGTF